MTERPTRRYRGVYTLGSTTTDRTRDVQVSARFYVDAPIVDIDDALLAIALDEVGPGWDFVDGGPVDL